MPRLPLAVLALFLLACPTSRLAAQGTWSPGYDLPGLGIGERVFALTTWRNELVAGTYRTWHRDGTPLSRIARFDGLRWLPLGPGVNGEVRALAGFQGDLLAGGAFTAAGTGRADHVARWDGNAWHPLGAGLDGTVWSLAVHQGALYAGGEFQQSGGQLVRGLARWDGSRWNPVGGGVQGPLGQVATVRALASDGTRLFVGGTFSRAGSTAVGLVAAWDGTGWDALGGGVRGNAQSEVRALAVHHGRVYCGGAFGQAGTTAASGLAAWDGQRWQQVGAGLNDATYLSGAYALCVLNDELHVGGIFALSGGTALQNIARFDGTALRPVGGLTLPEISPAAAYALAAWDGRLCAGGQFRLAGPIGALDRMAAVHHLAAWDGSSWSAVGDGLGCDGAVHALGSYGGEVVAGGRFSTAGGRYVKGLARFDGDDWRPLGEVDGLVRGMVDHRGELWIAGAFRNVGGVAVDGVARFDGVAWHAVGGGLGTNRPESIAVFQDRVHVGTPGGPRRWTGTVWEAFTPPISGTFAAMHVHQGILYFGGSTPFHPGAPNLFAWDGANLSVPGGGLNGSVESLGSFGAELVVGGRFTLAGGTPARCIARWNGAGWSTFGTGIAGATVAAITTLRGRLVVGGDFSRLQGAGADHLAVWTGAGWAALDADQPDGPVFALQADEARGRLQVGGSFGRLGTQGAEHVALWQTVPAWTDLGHALGTPRRTPHLRGRGSLLPGSEIAWQLSSARENAPAVFVLGFIASPRPLLGGMLVPSPDVTAVLGTDGVGTAGLRMRLPVLPGTVALAAQVWVADATGPQGFAASNGVMMITP